MNLRFISIAVLALLALSSCGAPKNIRYFQDLAADSSQRVSLPLSHVQEITVEVGDRLSVIVNSKDSELSNLFNMPIVTSRVGAVDNIQLAQNQSTSTFVVDDQGEVDFPLIGKVAVKGLSRHGVAQRIKERIVSEGLIKDPVVTVEFLNLFVSVMGEVNKPGRYALERDKVTILDALSMAGDLTIFGRRESVTLLRIENGVQNSYRLDLLSGQQLASSPVFYVRQGDVIYVEPNDFRARQSTVNGNNVLSTSFWISLASLATTISVLIFRR